MNYYFVNNFLWLFTLIDCDGWPIRILFYIIGMLICSLGVSLLFHSYISPEAYELFVKEIATRFNFNIHKVKTVYDCTSLLIGVILSFIFFGLWHFEGVSIGTLICALINGFLISRCTKFYEYFFDFKDKKNWRRFF